MSRLYLASSWRNEAQPEMVRTLREHGNGRQVYDFRNPYVQGPHATNQQQEGGGFAWSEIDPQWETWTPRAYRWALETQTARNGYENDFAAMEWADTGVLLLPSGRSAHIEAGYFAGHKEKRLFIIVPAELRQGEGWEPELMYLLADGIYGSVEELLYNEVI